MRFGRQIPTEGGGTDMFGMDEGGAPAWAKDISRKRVKLLDENTLYAMRLRNLVT